MYRFGTWTKGAPHLLRPAFHGAYFIAYSLVRVVTGIDIPRSAVIGPGLMIHHFGGIIINPRARIGAHCTLRQGVTVGTRRSDLDVPVIGDRVEFGAYAQVLGDVVVADEVTIGALSLVLNDVEHGATVVGIPARRVGGST